MYSYVLLILVIEKMTMHYAVCQIKMKTFVQSLYWIVQEGKDHTGGTYMITDTGLPVVEKLLPKSCTSLHF